MGNCPDRTVIENTALGEKGDGLKSDATASESLVPVPSARATGTNVRTSGRRGRILVIDDEAAVGRTIQRLLGDHEVLVVTQGNEAIELLRSGTAEFDLILCDLTMPDVTGMDVYLSVVSMKPEIGPRFVFMTGGTFSARARDFLEQVPNDRLDKPFDLQTVRNLARSRVGDQV